MTKTLADHTIVITGASSGIGLATAEQAAAAGARLVIVGREQSALDAIAATLLQAHAAQVLAVAADVGVREQVDRVALAAIERFGTFDTWINNAGVGLIASVLDAYDEPAARRVFDTNFWGMVNGSLAAAAHLRRKGGTIINVASITADHAVPLQTIYSASKHAVKGFTDGLRQELQGEGSPVHVVLVKPACIATPLIEHVAHPAGRRPRLVSPLYDPQDAARAILHAALHPQRDVSIGGLASMHTVASAVAPQMMELGAADLMDRQWTDEPSPGSNGNLFEPSRDSHGRTLGRHPGQKVNPSYYNRAMEPLQAGPGALADTVMNGARSLAQSLRRGRPG
ncbi:MAG TPA: SDR family oxidoreductase [Ramlibacter sp.]|nr:SDR family oxidoreductase [Ramlibacter sp.]